MSEHAKTVNVIRDGWFAPQRVWYRTEDALLAVAGERGWRVATKEEARDRFIHMEDSGKTACVAFDHAQVEHAHNRAEGISVGNVRWATDQEIEKFWEDQKEYEAEYRRKVERRIDDAAAKRGLHGGTA